MIISILLGIVTGIIILVAEMLLNGGLRGSEDESWLAFDKVTYSGWMKAIGGAIAYGAIRYFTLKLEATSFWLVVFLAITIGMLICLCVEWYRNDYPEVSEVVAFLLLAILLVGLTFDVEKKLNIANVIVKAGVHWLAIAMSIFTILYIVVLYFARNHVKWLLTAFAIIAAIVLIGSGVGTFINAAAMAGQTGSETSESDDYESAMEPSEMAGDTEESVEASLSENIHFYNDDVQGGDVEDDFDFGPNPYVADERVGYYIDDFEARRAKDPALLAATMVALDGTLGTDYIGEVLYEGYDEKLNMLERADAAAQVMATNSRIFNKANDAVNKLLDSASRVELKKLTGLEDQLYMNNATISGVPGIVSYLSDFDEGWCLIWTFQIKEGSNTTQDVAFHIPCGYQWTNGAEKIGVTPSNKPSNPSKPDKPTKPGGKGDKPDKPSKPKYDKDPSKAPKKNTEPNDDKGPGENTNNPSDPQHSTKDTKDSSSSGKDSTKKDKETNKEQKTGSDSSQPSTPAPKQDTKVDNNGDKANPKTPEKGKSDEIKNDNAGDAWGGPSD